MEHIIYNLNVPLALAAVLINAVFVVLVLFRTSMSRVFVIFLFICVSVIIWNLCGYMLHSTGRQYWFYLSLVGSAFIPVLTLHFIINFVRPGARGERWMLPAYGFSGLLASGSCLAVFQPRFRAFVDGGYWDALYLALLMPLFLGGLIILVGAFRRSASPEEKNRLFYLLFAGLIGIVTATSDHIQSLGVDVPRLGHIGSVFYPSILAIGVFKHRSAFDILAQMRDRLDVLGEAAAGIAHEVRNPLTSIKGASKLLADEIESLNHPGCRDYAGIIAEEVERLDDILANFQYYTRPLRIEKEEVPLNELIRKTLRLVELDAQGLAIRHELSEGVGSVPADAALLRQVFLNLIKNASEACGPGGELFIRTEKVSPSVRISFSDNGHGVSEDYLDEIFRPFFTTKSHGIGMGLPISLRIVHAHGGSLEVKSGKPKGTEFSILLPV
jgi:signal transduction histidine kinase